ncbi:MAG: methyltransferase [Deltaproteobacteria bacterium]|nr:methyltransferase [Candidatus Tharpella sp.]
MATTIEKPPHCDIAIEQPKSGYRYNQDPFILTRFIIEHRELWRTQFPGECLDLGTGVGIIPMLMARDFPTTRFTGIEIQSELAALAIANIKRNRLNEQIEIISADYRDLSENNDFKNRFKVVVCNPPYYPADDGRLNLCPQKRRARHELSGNLESLTLAAARFLAPKGIFILIFPAERLIELITCLRSVKLEPKRLQFIHPHNSDRAGMFILAAGKDGAPGIIIENPQMI